MNDRVEKFRGGILRKKAKLAEIEATLARLVPLTGRYGMPLRLPRSSRLRLQEERLHLLEVIKDSEAEYERVKTFENRLSATTQQGDGQLDDGGAPKPAPPAFDWQQIDHSLANLMLDEVAEEISNSIREEEQRIRFKNRGNENVLAIPTLRLQMQLRRTDEWAHRTYDVYREVWQRQGNTISPEFLRAVCANGIGILVAARTGAVLGELDMEAVRTQQYPNEWLKAVTAQFRREMQRLLARWGRRIEIDAKTYEHDRNALIESNGKYDHPAAKSKDSTIGKKLDRLRKDCGWSFNELAEQTGLEKKLILGHINRGKGIRPKTLKIYADAFGRKLERKVLVAELES